MNNLFTILLTTFTLLNQFNVIADTLLDNVTTQLVNKQSTSINSRNSISNYHITTQIDNHLLPVKDLINKTLKNKIIQLNISKTTQNPDVEKLNNSNVNNASSNFLTDSLITAKAKSRSK